MSTKVSHILVSSERWQKGEASVQFGSDTIYRTIQTALRGGKGALIGRHGTIELSVILFQTKYGSINPIQSAILESNAGIFPTTAESIQAWIHEYKDAVNQADVVAAGWYKPLAEEEWSYLQTQSPNSNRIPLRSLEPYYVMPESSWYRALEGQRVTVVSSFAETMKQQLKQMYNVWPQTPNFFPTTAKWSFVRSYYSPTTAQGSCEWPSPIQSWSDAVTYLETEIAKTNPQIVLLGCGGLAMVLAKRLKAKGIVAIVVGGAIQLLFGIKGNRWNNHDTISKLYNASWVKPSDMELPGAFQSIEGGCYW